MLTNIAQDLAHYQEAKRAKKLLFYAAKKYWENDWDIVDRYSWESLLGNLYENNPTISDLKALFYHAVNSLNRKQAYSKVAKYILQKMSILYQETYGEPLDEHDRHGIHKFDTELVDKIAKNIEHHQEAPRMKKLIFAACKQYWENDIDMINMYDTQELIRELRQLYPDSKILRKALDSITSTINRQNFYSFIADMIVTELTYLYKYDPVEVQSEFEEEDTRLILSKKTQSLPPKATQKTSNPAKETIFIGEPTQVESSIDPVTSNLVIPWLKVDNLFDLKQEIMLYTNPLKAKVILFYAIYQIDATEQDWSVVRTCTLEDLLINMFQHYGQDVQKIEAELTAIAQSRIEGFEPEDNLQVVNAVVEAVKHFHKKS